MKHVIDFAKTGSRVIPILNHIAVKDGIAIASDIDYIITHPAEVNGEVLNDGVYCPWLIIAGINRISQSYPIEDFPAFKSEGEILAEITLNEEEIAGLKWVSQAMSTEETRYYLNGVAFRQKDFVATDGHRAHMVKRKISKREEFASGLIVPDKVVKLALKLIKSEKAKEVKITFTSARVVIKIGNYTLHSKLVDGTFPAIDKVLPKFTRTNNNGEEEYYGKKTAFNPADIITVMPKLIALHNHHQAGRKRHIHVKFEKGKLWHTHEQEFGFETETKTDVAIGFNARYLAQFHKGTLRYGEFGEPVTVTSGKRFGLLMPCRV